ncbi:unnamed protein product [Caenorhabditis auriculariae]|uniref:Uncharacterized protein n=1 Tax=Caenorhabditis auriculariae TaxID=2777116 RepID=A0A8S1H1H9_9PELO|nr:unnamed protein product [Caenorhabditis auriculariae]
MSKLEGQSPLTHFYTTDGVNSFEGRSKDKSWVSSWKERKKSMRSDDKRGARVNQPAEERRRLCELFGFCPPNQFFLPNALADEWTLAPVVVGKIFRWL